MTEWAAFAGKSFPAMPSSVGEARRFVNERLPPGDSSDVVVLLVSEQGAFTVPTRCTGSAPREHGYGVVLVQELADRSGHFTDDGGRLHAWFEIDGVWG